MIEGEYWPRDDRLKVYLDVCCLCRPFDNQQSHRIRMETEAVIAILGRCMSNWVLVDSEVIEYEIGQFADEERAKTVQNLLNFSQERVSIDTNIINRAREIHELGIDTFDALHVASAESVDAVFITSDDALVKGIKNHQETSSIVIGNPVQWLMEVTYGNKNTQ